MQCEERYSKKARKGMPCRLAAAQWGGEEKLLEAFAHGECWRYREGATDYYAWNEHTV